MSQNSNSSKVQKQQRRPPGRLLWPASFESATSTTGKTMSEVKQSSRKRPRLSNHSPSAKQDATIWVDRFSPKSSADLCVAPKRVKEIKSWMEDAVGGNQLKLLVLVGKPGIGKSTMIRVLAKELSLNVLSWNESYVPRNADEGFRSGLLSVERSSPLDSFSEFLQTSGNGFSSLRFSESNDRPTLNSSNQKSIILLEELPNLHGENAAMRFRNTISQHLYRSQVPTVLIFSETSEGKHNPDDLERLIDPSDLYAPSSCLRQIQPVTKAKAKKVLDGIAKVIKCKITPNLVEELHLQSGGDIRHAIMNLQLHSIGVSAVRGQSHLDNKRDVKLSTFHALGKLLYAKRKEQDGRSILDFDPEAILERSDLGTASSLRFLEHHSVDFFTDIHELSNAFELYSDAATILDHPDRFRSESSFILDYVNSIAGRAVAHTNETPAPNKFRQFSTPTVFDVMRKRRENERLLNQLGRRLARCHLSLANVAGCTSTFITETLPILRVIVPDQVNPQVQNLYSIAQGQIEKKKTDQELVDRGLQEQAAILEQDDIVDYDSDYENEEVSVSNQRLQDVAKNIQQSQAAIATDTTSAPDTDNIQKEMHQAHLTNETQHQVSSHSQPDPVLQEVKLPSVNADIVVLDDSDEELIPNAADYDAFLAEAGFKEV